MHRLLNSMERGNISSSGTYISFQNIIHIFVKMPCELYTNQQKCRFGIGHQKTLLLLWYRNIQKCNSVDCKVLQKCNDETAKYQEIYWDCCKKLQKFCTFEQFFKIKLQSYNVRVWAEWCNVLCYFRHNSLSLNNTY